MTRSVAAEAGVGLDDPPGKDTRERSDTYAGELHRSGDWRVALCRDGLQFLLQHRRTAPGTPATAAWDNVSFCQTRPALLRLWRALTGLDGARLMALPDHVRDFGLTRSSPSPRAGREDHTIDKRQRVVARAES